MSVLRILKSQNGFKNKGKNIPIILEESLDDTSGWEEELLNLPSSCGKSFVMDIVEQKTIFHVAQVLKTTCRQQGTN